jgi:antitoxin CptB
MSRIHTFCRVQSRKPWFGECDKPRQHGYINLRPARPGFWRLAAGDEESMTGTTRSSAGLDIRRRQLLFRSWHRGMREMDLIMGRFADLSIDQLSESELTEFESWIDLPDRDLLAWITGEEPVPAQFDSPLFQRMRQFHFGNVSGEGPR